MGGNALKQFGAKRINRTEFGMLVSEVKTKLSDAQVFQTFRVPLSFSEKDDFGDIDILCYKDQYVNESKIKTETVLKKLMPEIMGALDSKYCSLNNDCLSVLYKDVQVDLIYQGKAGFEAGDFPFYYYSYNDLGGLLVTLFKRYGLKLTQFGLKKPLYEEGNPTNLIATLDLGLTWPETLGLLGLTFKNYVFGFKTRQDIYDFVISSPYFHPSFYYRENIGAKNRQRDLERATYTHMLNYIESKEFKDKKLFSEEYNSAFIASFDRNLRRVIPGLNTMEAQVRNRYCNLKAAQTKIKDKMRELDQGDYQFIKDVYPLIFRYHDDSFRLVDCINGMGGYIFGSCMKTIYNFWVAKQNVYVLRHIKYYFVQARF